MIDVLTVIYPIVFIVVGGLLILAQTMMRPGVEGQDSLAGQWLLGCGMAFVFAGAVLLMVKL